MHSTCSQLQITFVMCYSCRCGASFDVAVVSDAFNGKMLIARHRLVRLQSTLAGCWLLLLLVLPAMHVLPLLLCQLVFSVLRCKQSF